MCGITGFFSPTNKYRGGVFPNGTLDAATRSLVHRGPDSVTCWFDEAGTVGLGHARLSIIDLVTGNQPIPNEDASCHIVANGEFYDFERIQHDLRQRGHSLRSLSDSEVALHLYEERGIECLEELRGEFAFAIWDEARQRLFAARDRFGIKPFYYAIGADGTLLFGSEIKALAAAGYPLAWDAEVVGQGFYASAAPDRTLYRGVYQLPPGTYLIANKDGVTVRTYWDINYPREEFVSPRTVAEWEEQLRLRVVEAVRLRMRADVPVGCLLSGGLDSTAVLNVARSLTRGELRAFTIAFEDSAFDESKRAEETARKAEVELQCIPVTNREFAEVFSDTAWHGESFFYNSHAPAKYILSRAVRDAGLRVVLSGEGGDELTAGYRFCERALGVGAPVPPSHWPSELLSLFRDGAPSAEAVRGQIPTLVARTQALGFPDSLFGCITRRAATANNLLEPSFVGKWCGPDASFAFFRQFDIAGQVDGREPIKQSLYFWMKSGFLHYVLGGDRLDMANSVEQRVPFLDHKLFEFMRAVPSGLLYRDGREKWILREAMRPYLTPTVYGVKKHGFVAPFSTLRDGSPMLALAQDLLRSEAAANIPFLNHQGIVSLMDRLPSMSDQERAALDATVIMLMSAVVLQQRYRLSAASL